MFCALIQHACVYTTCNTEAKARLRDVHNKNSGRTCLLEGKLECDGLQPAHREDVEKMMEVKDTDRKVHRAVNNGILCRKDNEVNTIPQKYDNNMGDIAVVASLKVCATKKDLRTGSVIHTHIVEKGLLKTNVFVGSALVTMYAKCGALDKAQEAFDEVSVQNEVLWNALITGYAQNGHGDKALQCFEQMQSKGFLPNAVTFVCILKACGSLGALDKGTDTHARFVKDHSLENNVLVGNALIDMYAKCGALEKAQEVFNKLLVRNVVSWTVLIAGYSQHGDAETAISCFEHMQLAGFAPDAITFSCMLKVCGSIGALETGQNIHGQVLKERLFGTNIVVANALIDMYAKCGALEKAQELFDKLPNPNVVSWNVMIAGHVRHGHGEKALGCYERMQVKRFFPDAVTLSCILKACGTERNLIKGKEVHAQILREHLLDRDVVLGNALVDMYAKCGALEKAAEVFSGLPVRDVVSWNALIAGYVQYGRIEEAEKCFDQLQVMGLSPNAVTFTSMLKVCSNVESLDKGQHLHAQLLREDLFGTDIMIANALIDLYAKCCWFTKAECLFKELEDKSTASWNALISGYCHNEHYREALNLFEQMCLEGFSLDALTYSCIMKACSCLGAFEKGQEFHAQIVKQGILEQEIVVANTVIGMYVKCGAIERAERVFDELHSGDIVSWNALIAGYVQHGNANEALNRFEQMQRSGLSPDAVTLASILKACGTLEALDKVQLLHAQILQQNLLRTDAVLASTLVNMYVQCGMLEKAQNVFDELSDRNVATWTALISGYTQHGFAEKALEYFEQMHLGGFSPNAVTIACILHACGSAGAAYRGQKLHAALMRHEFIEKGEVDLALIVMYAKCGLLKEAQAFFDKLLVHDVVSWSALLGGYSQIGKDDIVLGLFNKMITQHIEPDYVAFTIILNTCSHGGLVDEGQFYFEMISKVYSMLPTAEHHTCMIDLFSRAGHLDKAVAVIEKMPGSANLIIWENLLGACQKWGNMKLGKWVFEHAKHLESKDAATYVYMSNIFADKRM